MAYTKSHARRVSYPRPIQQRVIEEWIIRMCVYGVLSAALFLTLANL